MASGSKLWKSEGCTVGLHGPAQSVVMEVATLCGVFAIDGGTLYLLPGPWSLEFHEQQCGGQVGLSREGSEEDAVVCGRLTFLTQPRVECRGQEPPQARV